MNLSAELSKPEYQTGTYAERLALLRSKVTPTIGRIQTGNLKNLEAIIASGLWRDKMADMREQARAVMSDSSSTQAQKDQAQLKLRVVAGFHEAISEAKIANKADPEQGGHSINMDDPTVQLNFAAAQHPSVGLITAAEAAQVMALATYSKPAWPDATIRDIVGHFNPALLTADEWTVVDPAAARKLRLRLHAAPPEATSIVVQMRELDDEWSDWFHVTSVHGVEQVRGYIFDVPSNGLPRQFRWKGATYVIDGTVTAV
jgi:hypothetical protein